MRSEWLVGNLGKRLSGKLINWMSGFSEGWVVRGWVNSEGSGGIQGCAKSLVRR